MPSLSIPEPFRELFTPARYKAFHGGRGSAKSHSFATALLMQAGKSKLRILCAREVQLSIKDSVKQLLDDKISENGMGGFFESTQSEIRGKNGSAFIFAGLGKLTTDQLKSVEGVDRCWVEEAQTISAHSLETLIPTIRKEYADGTTSEIWFSWNPRHASDPVDQRFRGLVVPERTIVRKVNYSDNPFFPKVLEEERLFDEKFNPGRYAHIWRGEYEPMAVGAIWDRQTLHNGRRDEMPTMNRIVVAVDPAISSTETSNEHGIICAGLGEDGRGYVIADTSCSGGPQKWAERAVATFDRYEADAIVVEINQGGDMVKHTLRTVRPGLPIVTVRATRGKHVRAEPVASLYTMDRISHIGTFTELENQLCLFTSAGYEGEGSPDRADALVWAITELFPKLTKKARFGAAPQRANSSYSPINWRRRT